MSALKDIDGMPLRVILFAIALSVLQGCDRGSGGDSAARRRPAN